MDFGSNMSLLDIVNTEQINLPELSDLPPLALFSPLRSANVTDVMEPTESHGKNTSYQNINFGNTKWKVNKLFK